YVTMITSPLPTLLRGPSPRALTVPTATVARIVTRAMSDGIRNVKRKSTMMKASSNRLYDAPIRVAIVYAIRLARPDLLAIAQMRMAPNRNHGVSFENPENASSNRL